MTNFFKSDAAKFIVTALFSFGLGVVLMFALSKYPPRQAEDQSLMVKYQTQQVGQIKQNNVLEIYRKPYYDIGFPKAQSLAQLYKPGTRLVGGVAIPNTQTVWFDITTLSNLVASVEKAGDGVRCYFATYEDKTFESDSRGVQQDYSNANTLILVPTYAKAMGGKVYHWDIGSGYIVPSDFENKGELCPPPSDCFTYDGASLLQPIPPSVTTPQKKSK